MLNIVLFGPPGAGKGTQSEKLIEKYQLNHISTGDLFRKHLSEGTELGKKAQKFMDDGFLVPDEVVIGMVEDKIKSETDAKGFIFDGFPRTVKQAEALDNVLKATDTPISGMIALEVPFEELKKRLLERGKISGRVDDQSEEKINNRIQVYLDETLPVSEYYKQQSKFNGINGVGSIDSIFEKISAVIENF
ncbi:adenylate kinase [Fulvivirga lutimaris]|uniref:adenylate kinase n=1 Tax=Fulvivirga lutimaris TaxID=1819566 RepID=UPI0012BD4963|nr:adenylate kinase [Fulvivirga lutimaris]MTI40297.1 adenylate kinase [Fulvivirga lutimaris]